MVPVDSVDAVVEGFRARFGKPPQIVAWAPGRVNLLGAHVDYNEGSVMPAAIDRGIWLAARATGSRQVEIESLNFSDVRTLPLDELPPPLSERGVASPGTHWSDYPAGVAWALQAAGHQPVGLEVCFGGNLPTASGVSSSAAVEMAFLVAWEALSPLRLEAAARPAFGRTAENQYLGVQSGIMDQYACLYGARGHLLLIDCRSLEHELIALPQGLSLLVVDTGVRRQLVGGQLNNRRHECERAVAALRGPLPGIKALRDVSLDEFERHASGLEPLLARRARHVVEECARVERGAAALRRQDAVSFGSLINASHVSSRDLYEVSLPELDLLAETAAQHPGCLGARLTGAGFGGCIAALVESEASAEIAASLETRFAAAFGRRPEWFASPTGDGARLL